MKISISGEVFEQFPDFHRGVLIARGIDNIGEDDELFHSLNGLLEDVRGNEQLKDYRIHPRIASWRDAFKKMSVNPNSSPPSIDNLVKRTIKGGTLPFISKVVCIFNIISLKHLVPLGGDDLGAIGGDLCLGMARGDENYRPLGRPDAVEKPNPGEIIYFDTADGKVLCRAWCWKNSDETKISPSTVDIAINVDGLPPVCGTAVRAILEELAGLIRSHCGGKVETYLLSRENRVIEAG